MKASAIELGYTHASRVLLTCGMLSESINVIATETYILHRVECGEPERARHRWHRNRDQCL